MQDTTRRAFLQRASLAGLGASSLRPTPARNIRKQATTPRARAVIHLHLEGGLSHIDTFDPKPDAPVEVRGPFATVRSKLDGEPLGQLLQRTAEIADKLTLVRSFTHTEADHDRGAHSVLTGYQPSPAIVYPALGAVVAQQLGARNDLPPFLVVPGPGSRFFGSGYLSAAFAPFSVGGDPAAQAFKVRDLEAPPDVDAARQARRDAMLAALDAGFAALGDADAVHAGAAFRRQTGALLQSPAARAAFDVGAESAAQKKRYGGSRLGMSCLLARRLAAAGARYVAVSTGGFDHHQRIGNDLPPRMAEVDQAFAALIADLDSQGLLQETLVLLTSEFGRTPKINADAGRDHWPRVFSVVLAGGGIKRGVVHGRSTATGAEPEVDPVRPADLAATVFTLLGIDPDTRLLAGGGRPIGLVRDGRVLTEILG
ncbi:MAG: DUF1501 domain-containing protein [Planctomycetota bacterium]